MFQLVQFEISGKCNAKCPWCQTGKKTRNGIRLDKGFIEVDQFSKAIDYLLDNGIVSQSTQFDLFNWGEPLLNPSVKEIVSILNQWNLRFGFSTNASIFVPFEGKASLKNLVVLTFSMPGFSQASYDRIHGFNFEKIKTNIANILKNFRACGFHGRANIVMHGYQFNKDEAKPCMQFAKKMKIGFASYYAYFNDALMFKAYLDSTLPYDQLKAASKDLCLFYVDDLLASRPKNYTCPQMFDVLTIDEECTVLTCCGLEKGTNGYAVGNLFDMSAEEILTKKKQQSICKECLRSGLAYLGQNPVFLQVKYVEYWKNIAAWLLKKFPTLNRLRKA